MEDVKGQDFSKQANTVNIIDLACDQRMSENWSIVCFKVRKFFQKSRNLHNYSKQIVLRRQVVHLKSFDWLIVLFHWIELVLLELWPVYAEIEFCVGHKKQQEVLNNRYCFLKLEVWLSAVQMIGLLLKFSDWRWAVLVKKVSYLLVQCVRIRFRLEQFIIQTLLQESVVDNPVHFFRLQEEDLENRKKLNPVFIRDLGELLNFEIRQPFLRQN